MWKYLLAFVHANGLDLVVGSVFFFFLVFGTGYWVGMPGQAQCLFFCLTFASSHCLLNRTNDRCLCPSTTVFDLHGREDFVEVVRRLVSCFSVLINIKMNLLCPNLAFIVFSWFPDAHVSCWGGLCCACKRKISKTRKKCIQSRVPN